VQTVDHAIRPSCSINALVWRADGGLSTQAKAVIIENNTIQFIVKPEERKGLSRCLLVQALEANHKGYFLGELVSRCGVN
jgi:hypothetical protein